MNIPSSSHCNAGNQSAFALEHAPYEQPCYISKWLHHQSIPVKDVNLWNGDYLPEVDEVSFLIIMGGPMNIYEHEKYPWLIKEKRFIRSVIDSNIPVLGICLGAQLISDVLGGAVTRLSYPEYGWISVSRTTHVTENLPFSSIIPSDLIVFQWHQDTFSIPPRAIHLFKSDICPNQGFIYNDTTVGLQFHPELDESDIRIFLELVEKDTEITHQDYPKDDIVQNISHYKRGNEFIDSLLTFLLNRNKTQIPR
jgi:GMP synthase (glutamine-hydrolysing)